MREKPPSRLLVGAGHSVLLLVLAGFACRQAPSSPPPRPVAAPERLTFNKDIAPILYEHCGVCHRPVEPGSRTRRTDEGKPLDVLCVAGAPFSLLEYPDVREHAKEIVAATSTRAMPPWLPEPGYGDFAHPRRLRDDQIAALARWADEGAVEGEAADKPPVPDWPTGWQLGTPDLVLSLPQAYTLAPGGDDVFRNFVIPVPALPTRYVRAMEFRADNPRAIHHASVGVDRARLSRKLDRADPTPGFASMPDDEVPNVYGWSPGKVPFMDAADTAWTLEPGSDLVLQLHMLPGAAPERIQPTVGLFFTKQVPTRQPLTVKLESKAIDIPAGRAEHVIEDRYVLPADLDVVSVYPHAHYLAREMKGIATLPDGTTKWLIWIKRWDFRWQDQYRYAAPLTLPRGTTLTMRFTYDNSDANRSNPNRPVRRVRWGPKSTDEMGALWLEVLPRQPDAAAALLRDDAQRSLRADIAGAEMQVSTSPSDPLAHNFLAVKYLQAGKVPEAIAQLQITLRLRPDDAEAHSNLASALLLQGNLPDATRHAREAARIKPDDDRVHFNLGNVMSAAGQIDEAAREFRRAVQLDPENADAHLNLALLVGPRGQLDDAVVHLRRAIDINPQNGEAHRNLSVALGLQGRIDEATDAARTAVRLQPQSAEAQKQLDLLLAARLQHRGR